MQLPCDSRAMSEGRFVCSRCAARHAEDASCASCGHAVLLDIDDDDQRERLQREELTFQRALFHRGIVLTAALTVVTVLAIYWGRIAMSAMSGAEPNPFRVMTMAPATIGIAAVYFGIYRRLTRNRRKFPFLGG